jgi:N-acetylglucosamine repressor
MAQRQLLKAVNRSSILNVIKTHGPIARTDIARLTKLSPATVTGLTAELIVDGLVYEKQEGDSRGGRRPILLSLDSEGAYVIGIKLTDLNATFALTDLNSHIISRHTTTLTAHAPDKVADMLAENVRSLLASANINSSRLLGVGIGMAGIVDTERGICRMSPFEGWRNVPFAEMLEIRLHYPVYLDNDVNTLTLVERLFGVGQEVRHFLMVTLGRGVGLGIVADGQIYRGATGGAGEFGHIVIDSDGPVCQCGNRGCLETFTGDPWLLRHARLNGLDVNTPEELVALAEKGNRTALDVFSRSGRVLGEALATLINLFNPSLIVISGEGVRAGDFMFNSTRTAIKEHTFGTLGDDVKLLIKPLSDDTWARGAASLVLGGVFHLPEISQPTAVES